MRGEGSYVCTPKTTIIVPTPPAPHSTKQTVRNTVPYRTRFDTPRDLPHTKECLKPTKLQTAAAGVATIGSRKAKPHLWINTLGLRLYQRSTNSIMYISRQPITKKRQPITSSATSDLSQSAIQKNTTSTSKREHLRAARWEKRRLAVARKYPQTASSHRTRRTKKLRLSRHRSVYYSSP